MGETISRPTIPVVDHERRLYDLLAELIEHGYRPAVQCTRCGSWLVAEASVAACKGPVCRAKDDAA
ncbi:MAG: hypothetical protein INR66_21195 [Gordonia polyisoprenivorans]|nr:hypothetical protein [Gordonia polyisoprenivorans]